MIVLTSVCLALLECPNWKPGQQNGVHMDAGREWEHVGIMQALIGTTLKTEQPKLLHRCINPKELHCCNHWHGAV